jgi:hypothetical protein
MADDIKEPDLTQPIKRLNYFTGQFLQKEDFLEEQQYHMAMRRHGNRVLYFGKGLLDESGFRINDLGTGKIEVTRGIAIDAEGREIVLVTEIEIDLTPLNLQPNSNYVVTVEYNQQTRDEQSTNDNDRSDFTRVLEEPRIIVQSPGSQSAGAIVIANLATKADGTMDKIEYRDRQRAKARFAGDLTIGQGGNGSLNARHINGKDWRNDTADDLYLNWNSAKNVVLGFGEGTQSSLHVSGNVGIGTTSPRAALEIRGPNSPTGNAGQREIALGFEAAGSARIRAYRGSSWDTTLQFLTNSASTGSDNPAVRLHIGEDGKMGIGTTTPRAKLEVADGAIMPAAGNSDASGILFPLDPGGGGGDKAWIRYFSRYPNDIDPGKKEQMTLEIGVANDNNDHIALISSGGVGIGTSSPTTKLEVSGGGGTNVDLIVNGRMRSNNDDGGLWIASDRFVGGHSTNKVGFWNGSAWRLSVQPDGNVGIGTMTPDKYRLMIAGGDTRIAALGQEQSLYGLDKLVGLNDLRFYVDDTGTDQKMHLDSNGLTVHGDLSWRGDNVINSYITLGNLRICWGAISANVNLHQNEVPVIFPAQFSGNPAVIVTVDDPGFGTFDLKGGVGAYQVSSSDFKILFKSSERRNPRNQTFYWIAIGQRT